MNPERPLPSEDLAFIGREGAALWPQLKGARILMTGATGFFGRWLLESLFAADSAQGLRVQVTGLSRDPDAFLRRAPHLEDARLSWRTGSAAAADAAEFKGERFDAVIHLETEADMQETLTDPQRAIAVIAGGTRKALEIAGATGARRFLFTSSGAVYGRQPPGIDRFSEGDPIVQGEPRDSSPYAIGGDAKRRAEVLCQDAARKAGFGAVIARCFTFAGPVLPTGGKFAFGNFLRDGLCGGPIVVTGDGTTVRSYLYAADLAVWLWTLLLRGESGQAYNVGAEAGISLRQLAEAMRAELGAKGVEVRGQATPGAGPDRYLPSTRKAREQLGLKETFTLPQMIRRTAAWHRAHVKH